MAAKKSDLIKLINWAESQGYQVFIEEVSGNNICFQTKTIEISSLKRIDEKIIILAHECGHILCEKSRGNPHPKGNSEEKEKINRLWNEMMSWSEGMKLLIKLEVSFNEKKMRKMISSSLEKYISAFSKEEEL